MSKMLQSVDTPEDLKKLKIEDLSILASEIRDLIIDVVSHNGGHLGADVGDQ